MTTRYWFLSSASKPWRSYCLILILLLLKILDINTRSQVLVPVKKISALDVMDLCVYHNSLTCLVQVFSPHTTACYFDCYLQGLELRNENLRNLMSSLIQQGEEMKQHCSHKRAQRDIERSQWCRERNISKNRIRQWGKRKDVLPGLVVSWNERKQKRPLQLVGSHQWKHASGAPTNYWMVQTQQRGKLLSICLCLSVFLSVWMALAPSLSLMTGSIMGKLGLSRELQAGSCFRIWLTPTSDRKSLDILYEQVNIYSIV